MNGSGQSSRRIAITGLQPPTAANVKKIMVMRRDSHAEVTPSVARREFSLKCGTRMSSRFGWRSRSNESDFGNNKPMAKGDFVEVLVDAGGGTAKEYQVRTTRSGRRVEVKTSRSTVEISELTRNGGVVRTAQFMAPRVLAVVEHPADEEASPASRRSAVATRVA
jgi:hypothetical protein